MSARIAVVDSGWARRRADPRVLPGACFVPGEDPADDDDRLGHGTACIGEVLRHAPGAAILPVRVFGAEAETSPEALVRAIAWATEARADVILLSLGTLRADARAPLAAACAGALTAGAVVVAAGHNADEPTWPAALPGVIGVWRGRDMRPGEIRYRSRDTLDLETYAGPRPILTLAGDAVGEGTSLAAAEVAGRVAGGPSP